LILFVGISLGDVTDLALHAAVRRWCFGRPFLYSQAPAILADATATKTPVGAEILENIAMPPDDAAALCGVTPSFFQSMKTARRNLRIVK